MENWFSALNTASDFWDTSVQDTFQEECYHDDQINLDPPQFEFVTDSNYENYETPISIFDDEPSTVKSSKMSGKGKWTQEECKLLTRLAKVHKKDWEKISEYFPDRTPEELEKQQIKRKKPSRRIQWTDEEDNLILDMHLKFGGNWKKISDALPGRPADAIKNRYYSTLKKRLPVELRSSRSRYPKLAPDFPEIITPALPSANADVDQFFSFSDAVSTTTETDDRQTMSLREKKEKIMSIYSKMARLEAFLNHTKQEIKKIEKNQYGEPIGEPTDPSGNDV